MRLKWRSTAPGWRSKIQSYFLALRHICQIMQRTRHAFVRICSHRARERSQPWLAVLSWRGYVRLQQPDSQGETLKRQSTQPEVSASQSSGPKTWALHKTTRELAPILERPPRNKSPVPKCAVSATQAIGNLPKIENQGRARSQVWIGVWEGGPKPPLVSPSRVGTRTRAVEKVRGRSGARAQ